MNKKSIFIGMCVYLVSSFAIAADPIDVVVVVEPKVYNTYSKEEISAVIQKQVKVANTEFAQFGISYNVMGVFDWYDNSVSEKLSQNENFAQSAGRLFYSLPFTPDEYSGSIYERVVGEYEPRTHALIREYNADNLVFISAEADSSVSSIGMAYRNLGVIVSVRGLFSNQLLLAHEWGHNLGFGHTSRELCATANYLMCSSNTSAASAGLTEDQVERLNNFVARKAFPMDYFEEFYLGDFSEPMERVANIQLNVLDNPIVNTVNSTEVIIELVDDEGELTVLDKDIELEVYTKAGTAQVGKHYDEDLYQRVTLAAGESAKRLDLNVNHDSSNVSFDVGTRYGLNVRDSNVVNVTVNAKETSTGDGSDNGSSSDSGGALHWFSLLLLAGLGLFRTRK